MLHAGDASEPGRGARTWDDTRVPPTRIIEVASADRHRARWLRAPVFLGGAALIGVALIGVAAATPDASPTVIFGIRAAKLTVGIGLAVLALLAYEVRRDVRVLGLATSAALFAGILLLDLVQTGTREGSGDALRASVSIVAAWRLAGAFRSSTPRGTTSPKVDLLLAGAAVFVVWTLWNGISTVVAARVIAPAVVLHLLASTAWAAAGIALLKLPHRTPLLRWVAVAAFALQASDLARCFATLNGDRWLTAAAGARSAALLIVAVAAARLVYRSARQQAGSMHTGDRPPGGPADDTHCAHVHEVRNAVLAVEGASLVLLQQASDLPADDRHRLSAAINAGFAHLRELVDPQGPPPERAELLHIVMERAALAEARGVPVELSTSSHAWVRCPPSVVTQVLDNLVENAIDHGEARRHGLRIELRSRSRHAVVRVCDGGPGIPAGERERVFDPRVRLHPDRPGEGLGLAIARHDTRSWGGELRARARHPRGVCFELSLPLVPRSRRTDHRVIRSAPRGGSWRA
jgi:signal transduction histidine kinase